MTSALSHVKSLSTKLLHIIHPDKFAEFATSHPKVIQTNAAAMSSLNLLLDSVKKARKSKTSPLPGTRHPLAFFVYGDTKAPTGKKEDDEDRTLSLRQCVLQFPNDSPDRSHDRMLPYAERELERLLRVARSEEDCSVIAGKGPSPSLSPKASPSFSSSSSSSSSSFPFNSAAPPPRSPRSSSYKPYTAAEKKAQRADLKAALREMKMVLSTGAHLETLVGNNEITEHSISKVLKNIKSIDPETAVDAAVYDRIFKVLWEQLGERIKSRGGHGVNSVMSGKSGLGMMLRADGTK